MAPTGQPEAAQNASHCARGHESTEFTIEFDTAGSDLGDSDLALRGINDPHAMRDRFDRELLQRDAKLSGGV